MIIINGEFKDKTDISLWAQNRGLNYGDAVFETIRVNSGSILFWEDHYFRLMASMRISRMQIPMNFTQEYLETQISSLIEANKMMRNSVRVKLIVYRKVGGTYTPLQNDIEYMITVTKVSDPFYQIKDQKYEVALYKDHYVAPGLLSTIKSNNKLLNVLAGIYVKENHFDNGLILNTNKMVTEAINGNLFLVKGNIIKTPPLEDGCLRGIFRAQLLKLSKELDGYQLEESSISPFELQKADELFITNVIKGIQPVTKYRKKEYTNKVSKALLTKVNIKLRLGESN